MMASIAMGCDHNACWGAEASVFCRLEVSHVGVGRHVIQQFYVAKYALKSDLFSISGNSIRSHLSPSRSDSSGFYCAMSLRIRS